MSDDDDTAIDDPEPSTEADRQALRKRVEAAVAPTEEWAPETQPTTEEDLSRTLDRADQAIEEGHIEEGPDAALTLYLSVLTAAPDNARARAGIETVRIELIERAQQALDALQHEEAARLAEILDTLQPGDADIQQLKQAAQTGREVDHLLTEAERLIAADQRLAPRGDNALDAYREAQRIAPEDARIDDALNALEHHYLAAAMSAAATHDWPQASRQLRLAGRVLPGSAAQQNAGARLVELRQEHAARLLEQANAALLAKDADAAESVLVDLEAVGSQLEDIDLLRIRIENVRRYDGMSPGQGFSDRLAAGASGPDMVVIPVGQFRMGSPRSEADRQGNEGPAHAVVIERGFAAGRTEVTLGQFRAFVRSAGYQPSSRSRRGSTIYDEKSGMMVERGNATWESDYSGKRADDEQLPVVHVSWQDASAYAQWLATETGKPYRLLTEAEFEYLLRDGSDTPYPWGAEDPPRLLGNLTGDGDRSPTQRQWANAFSRYSDGFWGPAPVGRFEANAFGLHDLIGNVSEWVEDCWHDTYQRAPIDGSAWVNPGCRQRVVRGASWASSPDQVRSAYRIKSAPETTNARLGFRVARDF